jgi:hypothetical protein
MLRNFMILRNSKDAYVAEKLSLRNILSRPVHDCDSWNLRDAINYNMVYIIHCIDVVQWSSVTFVYEKTYLYEDLQIIFNVKVLSLEIIQVDLKCDWYSVA